MSFFDSHLPSGITPVDNQYKFICSWPSLLRVHVLEAQQIIQREAGDVHIILWTQAASEPSDKRFEPFDKRFDRVVLYYDSQSYLVTRVPIRG